MGNSSDINELFLELSDHANECDQIHQSNQQQFATKLDYFRTSKTPLSIPVGVFQDMLSHISQEPGVTSQHKDNIQKLELLFDRKILNNKVLETFNEVLDRYDQVIHQNS